MSDDIVPRLRRWSHDVKAVPASDLMDEAAAEIERLRNGAQNGCETVPLSDEEREAVEVASEFYIGTRTGRALSGLLERMK